MNNYNRKTLDPRYKGGEHHGYNPRGNVAPPSGSVGQAVRAWRHRLLAGRAQVMLPSPAPTMKKNSHQQPIRRNLVNTQRSDKETRTEFFTGHVGRATNAHEEVTNNNPSIQEGKEAPGHSTGQQ